ncbi:MAG: DNA-binding protein [Ruminococcaceae bacterium]|nr:DNA-binding protein [Oscillospiraceae bacterium]
MQEFIMTFLPFLFVLCIVVLPIIIIVNACKKNKEEYESGSYYQITKIPYSSRNNNLGNYGEYLIYNNLKKFETTGAKLLFNLYIPKSNGETTEIDVLMICSKGIFVFESKNYSGWIFGSETGEFWYQTLPVGHGKSHKECFYNPILQNMTHIKYLKQLLRQDYPMRSIIIFSDRCTLKSIKLSSKNINVINRCNLENTVASILEDTKTKVLDESEISKIYKLLYPYSQASKNIKSHHVEILQNNNSLRKKENSTNKNNEKVNEIKCPVCDGYLVVRTVKEGWNAGAKFYGCSNYPKCRFTRNL